MNMTHDASELSRRRLIQGAAALGIGLTGSSVVAPPPGFARTLAQDATPVPDDLTALATDVWVYGYPLISMAVTEGISINVPAPVGTQAPINQIANLREFPTPDLKIVVAPNVDTLYSSAFLDLAAEPLVFQWPDMGDRYYLFPFVNAWTDVDSFGSRNVGQGAGTLVIAGPSWDGSVPAGIDLPADTLGFRVPTNLVWMIGRIYCSGTPEDYTAVHAIQDQLRLTPLSAFGSAYTPPVGRVEPAIDETTPPVTQANTMPAEAFFGYLAALMAANPPYPADAPILARMATLGIEPGKPFAYATLDPAVQQALEAGAKAGLQRIGSQQGSVSTSEGAWTLLGDTGNYGADYLFRAVTALIGLGANLPADAIYPLATVDSAGEALTGANRYVVHFDSEPPVKGFWSLTAYDAPRFLIANPIDRYALRGSDPLVKNSDGSFDLYLQAESPGADKEANWLPTGTEAFAVYLRFYWPEEAIIDGTWTLPTITKAS